MESISKIELREMRMSDAKRLYEILSSPSFEFISSPASLEETREHLALALEKKKAGLVHDYAILYGGEMVGKIGIRIERHHRHNGELNYFIGEEFHGKGIATQAVRLVERIAFGELGISRIGILMYPKNVASEKVAIKAGYRKEGVVCLAAEGSEGEYFNVLLYAKVKESK